MSEYSLILSRRDKTMVDHGHGINYNDIEKLLLGLASRNAP